jgi:hypothetical protein
MGNHTKIDAAKAPRREWQAPRLARLRAGQAELGANPIKEEGVFAKGS